MKYPKRIYATWEGEEDGPDGNELAANASAYNHYISNGKGTGEPVRCGLYALVGMVELHGPTVRVRKVRGTKP